MSTTLTIAAASILLLISGCTSEVPPAAPAVVKPAIGTVGFDEHLCEMQYTGGLLNNGWDQVKIGDVSYCYKQIGVTLYDAYYWYQLYGNGFDFDALQPVFRRDFDDGTNTNSYQFTLVVFYIYADEIWRRVPVGTDAVEVYFSDRWMPEGDYEVALAQSLATQSAQAQADAQAKREQAQIQVNAIKLRALEIGSIWLQPACNSSYNGCR
jgi:hypothetical protein